MLSLRTRLIIAASLVLAAFVALCGAALERAYHDSLLQAEQDKLEGLVYAILGAVEPDASGQLVIADDKVPDPRLRQPQSGLDAAVLDESGKPLWQSIGFPQPPPLLEDAGVGSWKFQQLEQPASFALSFGLRWVGTDNSTRRYTLVVLEDMRALAQQTAVFRRTLWLWLVGSAVVLLLILIAVQAWGLHPLRGLARELHAIEGGRHQRIEQEYPRELAPLTDALNAMITAERSQQTRYRHALGDLAHSLKTPLAVLRGHSTDAPLQEQVSRMQHIVDYQLRRAATAGSRTLSEPVALRPLAEKICAALAKVYADKQPRFDIRIAALQRLRADQGDLYELLGNLLDNATKYGRGQVRVSVENERTRLRLIVEDDGPGFPGPAEHLLQRGVRADDQTQGQGIGLSAVAELIKAYAGTIELGRSAALGGGRVTITL